MAIDTKSLTQLISDFRKLQAKDSITPESLGSILQRIAFVRKLEQENPKARKQDLAEHAGYTSMRSFYRNYNLFKDYPPQ